MIMGDVLIKIGWAVLSKLLTEKFLAKAIVYCLQAISERTTNDLDDKMVRAVAEALGVTVESNK